MGKSRFPVVHMGKDMRVMAITTAWLTQKNGTVHFGTALSGLKPLAFVLHTFLKSLKIGKPEFQ